MVHQSSAMMRQSFPKMHQVGLKWSYFHGASKRIVGSFRADNQDECWEDEACESREGYPAAVLLAGRNPLAQDVI
jgi:hypothetical protein